MTESPSAHIIIVNYNAGEWLTRALKSVLTHGAGIVARVTVVDNASSDNSLVLAQQQCPADHIDWVLNTQNRGFAAANNQVLSSLEQDYAVLMNPDCELRENTLPSILQAFANNQHYGIASCRILNEDGSLQTTCRRRFPTPWSALVRMSQLHRLFPNSPKFRNFDYGHNVNETEENHTVEAISGAFMVVKREAMAQTGLLDEGYFMHCEDLDWCKRFDLAGWQVGFVPSGEVMHAKGVSSASRPVKVLWTLHKGMNRFFDKFYQDTYAWPIRYIVKLGIIVSFSARAFFTLIRSVLRR